MCLNLLFKLHQVTVSGKCFSLRDKLLLVLQINMYSHHLAIHWAVLLPTFAE